MAYFEHTHYYRTPREMDVLSGKGPGTHDHDSALCGNGSFHFKRTKSRALVTCDVCRQKLGLKPVPMQTFEVIAHGFDGAGDDTDNRVFWVKALNDEAMKQALSGTRATYHAIGATADSDIDFYLPNQFEGLKAKLMAFEGA